MFKKIHWICLISLLLGTLSPLTHCVSATTEEKQALAKKFERDLDTLDTRSRRHALLSALAAKVIVTGIMDIL